MLWDPSFDTWRALGVQANSQFVLLAPDLSTGTDLVYGFNDEVQTELVSVLSDLDL